MFNAIPVPVPVPAPAPVPIARDKTQAEETRSAWYGRPERFGPDASFADVLTTDLRSVTSGGRENAMFKLRPTHVATCGVTTSSTSFIGERSLAILALKSSTPLVADGGEVSLPEDGLTRAIIDLFLRAAMSATASAVPLALFGVEVDERELHERVDDTTLASHGPSPSGVPTCAVGTLDGACCSGFRPLISSAICRRSAASLEALAAPSGMSRSMVFIVSRLSHEKLLLSTLGPARTGRIGTSSRVGFLGCSRAGTRKKTLWSTSPYLGELVNAL